MMFTHSIKDTKLSVTLLHADGLLLTLNVLAQWLSTHSSMSHSMNGAELLVSRELGSSVLSQTCSLGFVSLSISTTKSAATGAQLRSRSGTK